MPRPKRSKVAPSAPTARVLKPTATSTEETSSPRSPGRTNGSDDSDGLVTTTRAAIPKSGLANQEFTMSGALDPNELGGRRARPPTGRQRATLSKIAREADHVRAIEALRRRRDAVLAAQGGGQVQVPSSQATRPVEDTRPPTRGKDTSAVTSAPVLPSGPSLEEQGTPAVDSSVLAIAKFKRRPRQPSILQLVQQHDNRAEEQDGDEDLDDFQPDDESTPFLVSKTNPQIQDTPTSSSSTSQQLPGLAHSRKRKFTPPVIQIPRSQSSVSRPTTPIMQDPEVSDVYSIAGDEPELPTQHANRAPSPQPQSDTMAPPQSSSPANGTPQHKRPTRTRPTARSSPRSRASRKKPVRRAAAAPAPDPKKPLSVISEPASPAQPTRKRNARAPTTLSTATLQNLLPRRRRRPKQAGEFDIPSSDDGVMDTTDLGEDEDELSHVAVAKRVGVKKNPAKTPASKKRVAGATVGRKMVQRKAKGATRTYARKVSDKENEPRVLSGIGEEGDSLGPIGDDDETGDVMAEGGRVDTRRLGPTGKELQKLAQKFHEVDKWALEFEEVTASSSSPRDAR